MKKTLLQLVLTSLCLADTNIYTAGCNDILSGNKTFNSERVNGFIEGTKTNSYLFLQKLGIHVFKANEINNNNICDTYLNIIQSDPHVDKKTLLAEITKGFILNKHGYTKKEILKQIIILKK